MNHLTYWLSNPHEVVAPKSSKPSKTSIPWTVQQILGVDILSEHHAKPYSYFEKRGVTILDWKVLLIAHPEFFIKKRELYCVYPAKVEEFIKIWRDHLNNPKRFSPSDHVYLRMGRDR